MSYPITTRGGRGSGNATPYVPALGDLVLSGALIAGVPSSGTILNASTGSAITSSVSGLTVNSAARTYSYNGSGSAGSTNNGLTETLAGATFSPRGNVVTIVSAAVPVFTSNPSISPQSGNVGGTFSGIDGAMSNGGSILSRRWLLNGTSIGSGTTVVPSSAGSLVFENTGTGNVVASSSAVTVAAVAGTPSIAFAAPTASVAEGDSGTKTVSNVINVTRNGVTGPLTVNLSYSGTAASGTDYVAGPVSGTIADGQTSLSFDLTISGDTGVESDETIVINAVLAAYTSATASKTITVTNDDISSTLAAPTITGGTVEGSRRVADPYPWADNPEYRWGQHYIDGAPVSGSTFRTATLGAQYNGKSHTYAALSRLNGVTRTTPQTAPVLITAAAPFSLDQFPAGALIEHDPAFGITADGTTGAISAWAARRGAGTFTQATAANMPVLRAAELGSAPAIFFGSSSTVGRALVSDEVDSGVWIDTQIIIRGGKEGATQPSVTNNKQVYGSRRSGDQYLVGFTMPSNNSDPSQTNGAFSGIGAGSAASTSQFIKGVPTLLSAVTQPAKRKTSVNGASVFSTPLSGTAVSSIATAFGSTGTNGPIMSLAYRLRLSLDALAGSYTQFSYARLLEGYSAWKFGLQATLPTDHLFASRAPSAADFANKVANVSTWGNSLTNGMSIHISNGLAYGDIKGNYLYNAGVGGETAAQIWDRFQAGFDTGAGTTTGEPLAIQRARVAVIGDLYTNGFGSTTDTSVTSTRQVVDRMVAAYEAAQGVTAGNGRIVVLGRWRLPIQALNDPATDSVVLEDNYLRTAYPNYFCDWCDYIWSLGAPDGLYPDATNYAKHVIPSALALDNTHPTGTGYQLLGTYIANFIKAKGWDRA